MWRIENDNDTGPNGECFWEWWEVTDNIRVFKANCEEDAKWLLGILNKVTGNYAGE